MKIAIVGATGLVGQTMIEVLSKSNLKVDTLIPAASERSIGKKIVFRDKDYSVVGIEQALMLRPDIALFSAGAGVSKEWAPRFAKSGTKVIDNSSAWRMEPHIPLVVPSVNGDCILEEDNLIANPNCSTIQMVMALAPLHRRYKIKRIVVSTYQSVTGTGMKGLNQLESERAGLEPKEKAYHYRIEGNVIPHCDVFLENGYTKEEMKLVNETKKILNDNSVAVTATAVRVPTIGGHSESVNVTFENDFSLDDIKQVLSATPGIELYDNPANNIYPMPIVSYKTDKVYVGRLRRDESMPNSLNLWVVADNLRIGAATNAVWIAELLVQRKLV
ncbi:MAG TPA: aspartate-semialdehyde dehydrogenase [Salinivirgaceae bacterium]|nr:aspartate-semialdehyde dehydrogenase [Salinivirgaceae bacterium]